MKMQQPSMRPCECLVGLDLKDGWHVESFLHRPATATGGKFSVGYLVTNGGKKAYLKALDFSAAFQSPDPARELENLTKAYNFERDLLSKCTENKLDRVVTPILDGWVKVPGSFGDLGNVAYLIFTLAKGDIRKEIEQWTRFDVALVLRSLHHSAVGLSQLHKAGIAHQDLKPSNILVFPDDGSKLSDLGRSAHLNLASVVDGFQIPGDIGYAPPEQWYGWRKSPDFSERYVADLYQLGSLLFFFFLNCSATAAIGSKISQKHDNNFTQTDFLHDLPYIQNAFSESISELRLRVEALTGDLSGEIIMVAQQLCEPDPRRRGDPKVLEAAHIPQHDLQPYISRFDRLAKTAELRIL